MKTERTSHKAAKACVRWVFGFVLGAATLALLPADGLGQKSTDSAGLPHPHFRYLIVFNDDLHNGRLAQVLMDPRAFSEENLIELFKLVAKRFPEPEELHVGVFTSLEQLPTPEEQDYLASTNADSLPFMGQIERYPGAVYKRFNGNEAFRYSAGNGHPKKTVIIKGKNPFEKTGE